MSEYSDVENREHALPEHVSAIFERLDASDVEQFYKSYRLWSLQQRIEILRVETEILQHAVTDNDQRLQQVRPSAIALASLAQFQASGVEDVDLLDRMLERGEGWLDHSAQLLKRCEELDMIGGDYTQWCEHALEGAYDWIESMNPVEPSDVEAVEDREDIPQPDEQVANTATEEQVLQKLLSEDETEKASVGTVQDEVLSGEESASGLEIGSASPQPEEGQASEEETEEVDEGGGVEERAVPKVRQGGLLRRLRAHFWHD